MKKQADNTIAVKKNARFEYHIGEQFECGMCLQGWEVKSLRAKPGQINESHVIIKKGEAFLLGSIINPLTSTSSHINADPSRTRKLLLTKRELSKLIGHVERKGFTLVPLSMYWHKHLVKIKIALAKGKKLHDKRQDSKEKDWQRQKARLHKLS